MRNAGKLKDFLNSPTKLAKYEENRNYKIAKDDRILRMISGVLPNDLYVSQCGIDRWTASERKKVSGSNVFHSLHYVVKGEGTLEFNGRKYKIGKNTMFVVYSGIDMSYCSNPKDPWTYVYVDIGGLLQSSILKKLGFAGDSCIYRFKKDSEIESRFYKVYESSIETGTRSLKTLAELYGLLAEIEKLRYGNKPANHQERYVREALTYIENNIATADVNTTAADCAISPTYLTRICKSFFGLSLKNLITLTRLQVACNYLKFTRKTVKEVGESVGFSQRKYFTRIFKSVFDVTPSQYRNEK